MPSTESSDLRATTVAGSGDADTTVETGTGRPSGVPMIIDCDPGHDDAVAIVTAAHVADVRGIVTVAGNAHWSARRTMR